MMKYIRENRHSYSVVKGSRTYAKLGTLDDAIFVRDLLIENDWNLDSIPEIHESDGEYVIVRLIDERLHVLAKSAEKPTAEAIDRMAKKRMRNPNGSRYGLNIMKVYDTFIIKKRIAGEDYIFGYYDSLEDAEFVRNFLMDNMWDVDAFSQIEFDEDVSGYRVVEVIDGRAYVLDTFKSIDDADVGRCRREFLSRISKHRFGLASYPHLDELAGMIPELEDRWAIKAEDENWSFDNAVDALTDIIFKMTPWQKIVYDAVDHSTFEDIRKALARYRSGNFDEKIQRNLDELVEMGVIVKRQDCYEKTNF
jgi:hypothetical protein